MNKILTISRRHGSGGREMGKKVAEILGIKYYDKELLASAVEECGLCKEVFETQDERPASVFSYMANAYAGRQLPLNHQVFEAISETMRTIASRESCVFIGRCADFVLRDFPKISVFAYAPLEDRMSRAISLDKIPQCEIKAYLEKRDAERKSYYNFYTDKIWDDMENYDLCLNTSTVGIDESAKIVALLMKERS